MRVERAALDTDPSAAARALRRTLAVAPAVVARVEEIVARVRAEGDEAVAALSRELDTGGADPGPLVVPPEEVAAALERADPMLVAALELAAANVRDVAASGVGADRDVALPQGQRVRLRELPVRRAAVYVPGGRAPYPSTVVMGAMTARVAGVEQIVVCSPPSTEGRVHDAVLAACAVCDVGEVLAMGGAQAVAALAHGTATVPPVDVIVGPGSLYVQEAKRQVAHLVGIDGFAGPSELLVILDGTEWASRPYRHSSCAGFGPNSPSRNQASAIRSISCGASPHSRPIRNGRHVLLTTTPRARPGGKAKRLLRPRPRGRFCRAQLLPISKAERGFRNARPQPRLAHRPGV